MNTEFFEAVKILEKEKGVPAELLYEKIQTAIIVAVRKNYHDKDVVCCEIKPEESELNVFLHKTVVNEISDPDTDILTEEAQKYKPVLPGDIVEIPLEPKQFGRIAAQTVKHVIRQGIREAERGQVMQEFQSRQQEITTAKVTRVDPVSGNATLEIGRAEAVLPKGEQVPGETIAEGDLIKVYIVDVRESEKGGPKAIISRTHRGWSSACLKRKCRKFMTARWRSRPYPARPAPARSWQFTAAIRMWMPWAPVSARAARAWARWLTCSAVKKSILLNIAKTPLSLSRRHWPRRKCSA